MFSRLGEQDIDRCMDLAERVGWPRERFKWQQLLLIGRGYARREADGRLSAMVVLPQLEGAQFVAMMVVDPALQGQGVGAKLLRHALEEGPPLPTMLFATDRGRPLYEKLGFTEVDVVRRHIGTPTPRSSTARAASPSDWKAIIANDAAAFGYARSKLLEPIIRASTRLVIDDADGFAIRWNNGSIDVVGPVVARDEAAAIALIDSALAGATSPARIDVPVEWSQLSRHLLETGFAEKGAAPMMTRPQRSRPGQRERYFALALQAFG